MESTQSGLLERLRQQRESMQQATSAAPAPAISDEGESVADGPPAGGSGIAMAPSAPSAVAVDQAPVVREHAARLVRLESEGETMRGRLDKIEAGLRQGVQELRNEIPTLIASEVARHATPTNEAVTELSGRVTRMETDFTRERERWSTVVTSFDQRLDHRLRSFRQDVTVMLAGMAVLILAMLMLLLMRR